jgi:hypothetical protein
MEYYLYRDGVAGYVFATTEVGLERAPGSKIVRIEDMYVCSISEEHLRDYLNLKKAIENKK